MDWHTERVDLILFKFTINLTWIIIGVSQFRSQSNSEVQIVSIPIFVQRFDTLYHCAKNQKHAQMRCGVRISNIRQTVSK